MSLFPSPPPDATQTQRGLMSLLAQTFAGVKTFAAMVIASAGVQVASLFNTNGGTNSDVALKLGTTLANGSVNAAARIVSVRTGINGTEVEKAWFNGAGTLTIDLAGVSSINGLAIVNAGGGSGTGVFVGYAASSLSVGRLSSGRLAFVATFAGVDVATTGAAVAARLYSDAGVGSSDVATVLGSTQADGSMSATAKLLSVETGINGTPVEKLAVLSTGQLVGDGGWKSSGGSSTLTLNETNIVLQRGQAKVALNAGGGGAAQLFTTVGTFTGIEVLTNINFYGANAVVMAMVPSGRLDQSGTDSSAAPGAAVANKPTGKNAIALGASSVVITNSLVTAASRVMITPHARDATCKELIAVPAAGSFTVSGSAAATAALPFSWEVSTLL